MATIQLFTASNNQLVITSTTTYTYRTGGIALINKLQTIPAVLRAGFYIYNNTNESITVTPIFNVFPDKSLPDASLSTTTTIPSKTASFVTIPDENLIASFISVSIKASTVPTSGYITGFCVIDYNYTIS